MYSLAHPDLVPARAQEREWLVSNGKGGYASSTVIGMNTRKYHGLLAVPTAGLLRRHVMLSKFEETAAIANRQYDLSTNYYPGATHPEGYRNLSGFSFSTHPVFTYSLGDSEIEKSVRMVHGKDAVVVSYRLKSGREADICARPLLAMRDIHHIGGSGGISFEAGGNGFVAEKPIRMALFSSIGTFKSEPFWYRNMLYAKERERGYAFSEDLFSPGYFSAKVSHSRELHLIASVEGMYPSEALHILDKQEIRREHYFDSYVLQNGIQRNEFCESLLFAADSFVAIAGKNENMVAGYHWFSPWGRDAMISLPGLLLCTGRFSLARNMLLQYSKLMKRGLLPNFISEEGDLLYSSSDASLWFLNALHEYVHWTGDSHFVEEMLWKSLRSLVMNYVHGNGIASMDSDGLLRISDPASTWMDARIGDYAVTPRKGKPVEINALWYSGLNFIREVAERINDRKMVRLASDIIENIDVSFQNFVSIEGGLMDVIEPNDPSVRPNQIFAVSLPYSPLNPVQMKHVFNTVRSRLYTPLGLQTLPWDDPNFHGHYKGGPDERDRAYHQGMIWPWLIGAFYDAQLKVYPGTEHQVLSSLCGFADAMGDGCVGSISEIYEPATMKPKGAISQAWSVAEVLRIYTKAKKALSRPLPICNPSWARNELAIFPV